MSKGTNQKFKLYFLMKIMLENTDEDHYLTMAEILKRLEEMECPAERKSIYQDLRDLEQFGIYVEGEKVWERRIFAVSISFFCSPVSQPKQR